MKFTTALAVLATAVISAVSAQTGTYTDLSNCPNAGPTGYAATNVTISPSPLCISKPFCLTATGILSTPITEGAEYVITGRWLGRVLYTDVHDLCSLLAANGQSCDVPAGPFNLKLCVDLKPHYPNGWVFDFQFHANNGDGNLLFCQSTPNYPNIENPQLVGLKGINCP
ncbi:hypothetical protein BG015_003704 [Linnemannia schmuckeri]|uniref:Phosphatidylglycerol/phosphatidylinositol transfer protein n=1 Tax=Linnemannia schmuckeri TaxID=64567 RepID=A0A9P5RKF9_9FUNG|nr:hypothetical protein BG015_003704 [Linnemannia schmuckeri]